MEIFDNCRLVNDLLSAGNETAARNEVIKLLEQLDNDGLEYTPLINNLIRQVGLFPYLETATSSWQERYVSEAFKVDVGDKVKVTLHREQSRLLGSLLSGRSIAVSAPTSFGKSFVIDSFISIKQPKNVVIIVPTIALTDETRRRLQKKFGDSYKIITTADQSLSEKNILVFPQERSIGYIDILEHIDILIVDEFYKASKSFDKERSPALIRSIVKLSKIADQRYFLAPNISELRESTFTQGMEFLRLDYNTVFLEKNDLYTEIGKDEQKKSDVLLRILSVNPGKTLIYAGTYTNINKVSNLLMNNRTSLDRGLLKQFQSWLSYNYDPNWALTNLVGKGVGIHNGQLHRSLSQIQIKLFEEEQGLDQIISTSSIIEGVNTSAKNVILWSNKNGKAKINDFTYKNIIGRGGRMFRHFVGKIFVLEQPPEEMDTQLELEIPDELLGTMDQESFNVKLTSDQVAKIIAYKEEMQNLVGVENFEYFQKNDVFQSSSSNLILEIARDIRSNSDSWNGIGYLNSSNTQNWDRLLYKLINLQPGGWEIQFTKYVAFVKVLSHNWTRSIPELLQELSAFDIGIDDFFKLERNTTFKLSALLSDVHTIHARINENAQVDLTPAISKISHAFLPKIVYQLEEYGIPRMISKKIDNTKLVDLENQEADIHSVIDHLKEIGLEGLLKGVGEFDDFDKYILRYFYEGIT
jgi:hypothetical protein